MEISYALNIILALALVIVTFINRKQIDLKQVTELIDRLAPTVAETPNQADDIALEVAKAIRDLIAQPGTDTSTTE